MKISSTIWLITAYIFLQKPTFALEKKSQLFLVGGGLKTCSSMSKKNCNTKTLASLKQLENVKHHGLYKIDDKSINLIDKKWPANFDNKTKSNIISLLNRISISDKDTELTLKQLKAALRKKDTKYIIRKLSDPEYYVLLDLLEQPILNKKTGERLKEHVELDQSTNQFSTEIYKAFVANAKAISGKDKPNIIVLTASARDIFEAADFYQTAFTQAGANAKWLPLDATLNTLMQRSGKRKEVCQQLSQVRLEMQGSVNREYVYPDLTEQQMQACLTPSKVISTIESADGVFINGGDQSLTIKAFINKNGSDNQVLTIIKDKLKQSKLVIGGTSAGTAVMSGGIFKAHQIPMITNGQSDTAIVRGAKKDQLPVEGCYKANTCDEDLLSDDLTYRSAGGLGLFHWGVMDTHFSERGRQGRLAKLVLDTEISFGFGVDEATALVVSNINTNKPEFEVIGQGGVFIVENNSVRSLDHGETTSSMNTHYISVGDVVTINEDKLSIDIAAWKNAPLEHVKIPTDIENIFDGKRYQQMAETLCRTSNSMITARDKWEKFTIKVKVTKNLASKSGYGLIRFKALEQWYCSYTNYELSYSVP